LHSFLYVHSLSYTTAHIRYSVFSFFTLYLCTQLYIVCMRVRGSIKKSIALLEDYSSFIYVYCTRKRWDIASDRQLRNVMHTILCQMFCVYFHAINFKHPFILLVVQLFFFILILDHFKYIIFFYFQSSISLDTISFLWFDALLCIHSIVINIDSFHSSES
jgi:hypothetical protein